MNFLLSGLPILSGLLSTISAVWLQRNLLLCQGWQLRSYTEDQKKLPVLQIQVGILANTFENLDFETNPLSRLCEAAGMKTTWVLTDEERKQKFEGRGKRKSCSSESPVEEGRSGEEASTAGRKVILSEEELSTVEGYVRASDYWEQSKVNDMDTGLIRQIIRMVAFRANLDESGQNQLRFLISERTTRFASSLLEFQSLCAKDRDQILGQNMGVVMTLKTCR